LLAKDKKPFTDGKFPRKDMMAIVENKCQRKNNKFQTSVFQQEP